VAENVAAASWGLMSTLGWVSDRAEDKQRHDDQ